jgi:2-deoxy-D-gluconate 3-dehydrogenase
MLMVSGCRYVRTEMTETSIQNPAYRDYQLGRTPAKRWGLPEDFRGAVVFLSSGASDFVTGTSIVVDGGLLGR